MNYPDLWLCFICYQQPVPKIENGQIIYRCHSHDKCGHSIMQTFGNDTVLSAMNAWNWRMFGYSGIRCAECGRSKDNCYCAGMCPVCGEYPASDDNWCEECFIKVCENCLCCDPYVDDTIGPGDDTDTLFYCPKCSEEYMQSNKELLNAYYKG